MTGKWSTRGVSNRENKQKGMKKRGAELCGPANITLCVFLLPRIPIPCSSFIFYFLHLHMEVYSAIKKNDCHRCMWHCLTIVKPRSQERQLVCGWDVFDFENHSRFFVLKFYWKRRFVCFYFSVYFIIQMRYFSDETNKQKKSKLSGEICILFRWEKKVTWQETWVNRDEHRGCQWGQLNLAPTPP